MTRTTVLIIAAVMAVAVIVGTAILLAPELAEKPETAIEDLGPAPDFSVKLLDGPDVSLDDFRGKPLIVNFWASWCPPCREETPVLVKTANAYKNRVNFLGIIYQDNESDARRFIKESRIPYKNALDPSGLAAQDYKITGVPETFFVDAGGHLRARWLGAISEEKLVQFIDGTLAAGD